VKVREQTGGVPRGAAGQFAFVEQQDILAPEFGELVGNAASGDPAADDNDLRIFDIGHEGKR
jgi:hypothetical protein